MKRPEAVRQQLVAGTVGVWLLLLMRLGFHAFPRGLPTYAIVVVALGMTGLLYLYPRMRDAAPDVAIHPTVFVKIGMGAVIVCAAAGLAWYVVSLKGAPVGRGVILLGALFFVFLGFMQWLTDRRQF